MSISSLIDRIGAKISLKPTAAEVRQRLHEAQGEFHAACIENRSENMKLIRLLREGKQGATEIKQVLTQCGHSCPATRCAMHGYAELQPKRYSENCPILGYYRTEVSHG